MATTIWKGAISFGLVTIPVTLHSAVREQGGISFNQLHAKDNSRIRYKKVCEREGKEVPAAEIVKGYEYEKGKYIVISDEELEQAERATSRSFEIAAFVKEDDVDPRYFDKPYYLAPMPGGEKAYALLRETMERTGSLGVGSFVLRKKTHLAGLKAVGEALVLEIMRYERELVDVRELRIPEVKDLRPQELKMAEQLVENLSEPFEPSKFRDVYTESLMQVIQAKLKGKKAELPEADEPEMDGVIDLMARLQESIKESGKKSAAPAAKKKAAPRKRKTA
ncbi:MAG TPA: Ku protein [Longimicrobium sp.]|jgi:DNA end-binding protein Ku